MTECSEYGCIQSGKPVVLQFDDGYRLWTLRCPKHIRLFKQEYHEVTGILNATPVHAS